MQTSSQPGNHNHEKQAHQTWMKDTAIAKAYLRPETSVVVVGPDWLAKVLSPLVKTVQWMEYAGDSSLAFPEASVEVVFAHLQQEHSADLIREAFRIVKPGGRLVITSPTCDPAQVRTWLRAVGLVNLVIRVDEQSGSLVATGTRRIWMQEAVKNAYGERARSGGSCCGSSDAPSETVALISGASCCGGASEKQSCCCGESFAATSDVSFITGYTNQQKAEVPAEAEEIALGCGNPTAMANLKPGETVLDIGSGGGMDAFLAARRVGPTGKVIGVDMTPEMLKRARAAAKKAGFDQVEFRHGQAEAIPVEDNSMDVVLSNCVINLCEDKGAVFQEAFRVLKPGGRLEVSDMVTDLALPLEARMHQGEWAGCVSGALPEQEYLDLIAQAGFQKVSAKRSASAGQVSGVAVFSISVSAVK